MKMHPREPYITENADDLRGRDIQKLIEEIWAKIGRGTVQKSDGLFFDSEVPKGPRYGRIITKTSPHWRLYKVAWEEYWNIPLIKALT